MRGHRVLLQVLGFFSANAALAVEINIEPIKYNYAPATPTWSVVGSFSPTFTDNALFSRDDRRKDGFFEPDVSLSARRRARVGRSHLHRGLGSQVRKSDPLPTRVSRF